MTDKDLLLALYERPNIKFTVNGGEITADGADDEHCHCYVVFSTRHDDGEVRVLEPDPNARIEDLLSWLDHEARYDVRGNPLGG